jgi:hypothetical protein
VELALGLLMLFVACYVVFRLVKDAADDEAAN